MLSCRTRRPNQRQTYPAVPVQAVRIEDVVSRAEHGIGARSLLVASISHVTQTVVQRKECLIFQMSPTYHCMRLSGALLQPETKSWNFRKETNPLPNWIDRSQIRDSSEVVPTAGERSASAMVIVPEPLALRIDTVFRDLDFRMDHSPQNRNCEAGSVNSSARIG